ncbi:MAG: SDR family oxidoreductase [Planctomycetaceae bacterium]|nr:SDR family oxidoreductase [Planctomycetaceae bacterium]
MKPQLADKWALITGASSGIGEEFAHQLASKGMHLILTARREDKLNDLAQKLFQLHGTKTAVIPIDLVQADGVDQLVSEIRKLPDPVSLVVNNAGFGTVNTIQDCDPQRVADIVQVNIAVVTKLTYEFLPEMIERNDGGVINIGSITAFQPVPYMGVYAASKAYVLHLTEALWAELWDTDVRVLALCPGPTKTEFFDKAGVTSWLSKNFAHTTTQVVSNALAAYDRNHAFCIPGIKNRLVAFVTRLASRRRVVFESKKVFHKLVTEPTSKKK